MLRRAMPCRKPFLVDNLFVTLANVAKTEDIYKLFRNYSVFYGAVFGNYSVFCGAVFGNYSVFYGVVFRNYSVFCAVFGAAPLLHIKVEVFVLFALFGRG